MRGGGAAEHEFRAGEGRRAAGGAGLAPCPAGLRKGVDSAGQSDPGLAGGVWHRDPAGDWPHRLSMEYFGHDADAP